MTTTAKDHRWRIPVAIIACCIAAASYYMFGMQLGAPRVRDNIDVRITRVDPANSEVEADFVHPKDGRTYPIIAHIDKDCAITIDGVPATLADLKVGDHAIGKGSLNDGTVEAIAIRVQRQRESDTQPAMGGRTNGRASTGG